MAVNTVPSYASLVGIKSLAAAIIFAVLYFPLFVFFVARAIARPSYVLIILSLFCAIRFTAFVLRALLINVPSDAYNLNLFIAYEILYNVGFFGILYSVYTLVADRVAFAQNPPNDPISQVLRHRFVFRIVLSAAVAIGIVGVVKATGSGSSVSTGNTLREVAIYIFFVCSILVLLYTLILARVESKEGGYRGPGNQIGATYGTYILVIVAILLVAREAFFTATAKNTSVQDNEAIWYPLCALTEFIAVASFVTPGLVPARSEPLKETSPA